MSGKQLISASLIFIVFFMTWQFVGKKYGMIKQVPVEQEQIDQTEFPVVPGNAIESELATYPKDLEPLEEVPRAVTETEPSEELPAIDHEEITLTNDFIEVVLDNRGAVIRSVSMLAFYETVKRQDRVRVISSTENAPGEIFISGGQTTGNQLFSVERISERSVAFKAEVQGVHIEKTYTLTDLYALEFNVSVSDGRSNQFALVLAEGLEPVGEKDTQKKSMLSAGSSTPKLMEIAWSENGDHESKHASKYESTSFEEVLEEDEILIWAGIKDTYFCNVFIPEEPFNNILIKNNSMQVGSGDPINIPVVAASGATSMAGTFYLGPLNADELLQVSDKLSNLVNYGVTGSLTKWLFIALKAINKYIGNWGWSIVILTIFIRLALFPLTAPSIKSGYRMRKLQPKIEALKKKYSGKELDTKQKLSQETWKLYKEEKVNPFSSCITILPQMPIFFAYFSLLRTSISLRQSEWFGWVGDLSLQDPIYVLPVLWGASMFLSQSMTPMPGDASQQKMMKFMPLMMTLFFLSMPSGLVLYMLTSNLFQLGQTVLFKVRYDKT